MNIKNIYGKEVKKNVTPYLIDWAGPSRSKFQFRVKQFFRPYWGRYLVFEEFPVIGSRKTVDLFNYNKKIVVEIQGGHHATFNKHFQQNKNNWLAQVKRDIEKQQWCELNGFSYIEIYPEDEKNLSANFFLDNFGISII